MIISTLVFTHSFAQKDSRIYANSPYSAIGIGDILAGSSIANEAMGGTGLTFGNGIYINSINPALLAKNRYVALNTGLGGQYKTISNGTLSQNDFGMNLNHLNMAFPVKKYWTTGISLQPYTAVESEVRMSPTIPGTDRFINHIFKKQGGLSKASWSNGLLIAKKLYLGVETGFYFGTFKSDTTSQLVLNNSEDTYLRYTNRTSLSGFMLKSGFAYQQKINDKWNINIGGTYDINNKLKGENIRTFRTLYDQGNGPQIIDKPDTLSIANGSISIPARSSIGISLESPYKWIFAVEYTKQNWKNYQNFFGKSDANLSGSEKLAIGIELLPKYSSTKYFNQVFYRLGYQYIKTPYLINGYQVKDNNISLGISTPLAYRSVSYFDFAVALGNRGIIGNGLVRENYIKVSVGFSMVDTRWFLKPKID